MRAILNQCPELEHQVQVSTFHKKIQHRENGMTYQALASEGSRNQGLSVYAAVIDEAGEFKKTDSFYAVKTATGFHDEALCLITSTSAAEPEQIFSQEVMHARKVLAGEIDDPTYYAIRKQTKHSVTVMAACSIKNRHGTSYLYRISSFRCGFVGLLVGDLAIA